MPPLSILTRNDYPTSDGKPMAETDKHRELMTELIKTLQRYYFSEPRVYVSGNLLMFYERGNKRKHISPDVFVVKGVPRHQRENYLVWEEGVAPQFVIELTSSSTRKEDTKKKFDLYRDILKVQEFFLFDPYGDYLNPRFQGYRLDDGEYAPLEETDGRLVSDVLKLHLEVHDDELRLYDPRKKILLPTTDAIIAAESQARHEAEREVKRLRRELAKARKKS